MGRSRVVPSALSKYRVPSRVIEVGSADTAAYGITFALLTAPACFAGLFRARKIVAVWISIGGWVGYAGARMERIDSHPNSARTPWKLRTLRRILSKDYR